jgi:hypothetical protein
LRLQNAGCKNRNATVDMSRRVSNLESEFPREADVDHRGALRRFACARRALSAGPIFRVRLDECVSLSSPLRGHTDTPRLPAKESKGRQKLIRL